MANEAASLARSIGSISLLDTAERTRQRLAGQSGADDPLLALTTREREIARLAATGLSSRDIASRLHLSPRTVDTHLSRIYRKLDLPSRAALAGLLARH
jgi:DNA-binding NarL/FixJ family response regulator